MGFSYRTKSWTVLTVVVWVGALLVMWLVLADTGFAQTPRPTLTPVPTDTPVPGPTPTPQPGIEAEPPVVYTGPILKGQVINLSTGEPEAGATVVFSTGDVSVETVSDQNGEYAFEHLGTANGLLNVVPPSGSQLQPVTADVAVQPKTGVETIVNLGVTLRRDVSPPLSPTVESVPNYVGAGELMTITILVKNSLPQAISGATVTDLLPQRAVPVAIRSSTGNPYFSDNLAVVELGTLDAGSGALVEITARVNGGQVSSSLLQGNVSFYYRENAAAQATGSGGGNGAVPTVLPVTGLGLPVVGLGLVVVVLFASWMRRRLSRKPSAG
jgi:hypothetical protein